ncbi:MAG: thiol reductase thioredoxin [Flavobacteriales bacterium]|nr:thiol reductase thioredoxin [Flavobacteriales bacterium]|tara:strand:- start:7003 stop:7317 length:315 start_codon:yes stop_codon:yes gene_type:complete
MYTELEEDNLAAKLQESDTVIVQYSAGWCGNCRLMKPKFKRMAGENENATFLVVDAEKFPESRKLADVNNLPTFAAFKGGELVKQVQTNKADVLKELIDEVTAN